MTKRKHSGESDADASYILLCPPPAKKVKTIVGAPSKPATVYKFKISSNMQQVLNPDKQNKKIWEDVRMQENGTKCCRTTSCGLAKKKSLGFLMNLVSLRT